MEFENPDLNVGGYSFEEVRNLTEKVVIKAMNRLIPEYPRFCTCHECLEDVYAFSLNKLPAFYQQPLSVFPDREIHLTKEIEQKAERIVRGAIITVTKSPHHE